ncbi:MAG: hypothetical protein M3245_00460, partial [Actinomycetota bacterium]|nr:hypothetical protein [Actinomycetota bacterium]
SPATLSGGGNAVRAGGTGSLPPACPPAVSTPTWLTGFESGVVSTTGGGLLDYGSISSGGSITADSATKRSGGYALRINRGSTTGYSYAGKLVSGPTVVGRFAVRLDSLANAVTYLARVQVGDGYDLRFGYSVNTGKFYMGIEGTAVSLFQFSSMTPAASTWYMVDFRFRPGANPRTIDWSVDGIAQTSVSVSLATASAQGFQLGTHNFNDATFTAHYDDVMVTTTTSDYPIGGGKVLRLLPDGMGTSSGLANFRNNDGTAIGSTTWSRLADAPMGSTAQWIEQVTTSSNSYVEFTFEDTAESCVRAVSGVEAFRAAGTKQTTGRAVVMHGGNETVVYDGSHAITTPAYGSAAVPGGSSGWGQSQLNGVRMRIGYSTRNQSIPYWDGLMVEYEVGEMTAAVGGAGPEYGYTASAVPPSSPTYCYASQTQGMCAYAEERHGSTPPIYETEVDLAGSGGGDCNLYVNRPEPTAKLSYAYGRRVWPQGGDGIVAQDVIRYYGTHQLGAICAGTVSAAPAGWNGFYVQYDAGSAVSSAKAQAGIGASFPEVVHAGTITYWNGNGVSTMSPTAAGGPVPVAALDYTSNGWRYQISGNLAVAPSSVTQNPTDAPMFGLANRTEARSVLGSPLTGTISYRVTNTATSEVVVDVTITVDLGSLTTLTRYRPAAT